MRSSPNLWRLLVGALALALVEPTSAQIHHLAEMNTEQIRALDRAKTSIIMPGGILEEHGPYLPSFSDGYLNEWLAARLAEHIIARPGWAAVVFPMIPLGAGGANGIGGKDIFPGTYAVDWTTLRSVFMDLGSEFGEQGFKWIFVVHLHGAPEHSLALNQAGDYFHDTYGGEMVHLLDLKIPLFAHPSGKYRTLAELYSEHDTEDGIAVHAGGMETSFNLFTRPDLVDPGYKEAPAWAGNSWDELFQIAGRDDWPGYLGSPRLATASYGAQIMQGISQQMNEAAIKIVDGAMDPRQVGRNADARIDNDRLEEMAQRREKLRRQEAWLGQKGY